MSLSGVTATDEVVDSFLDLKLGKTGLKYVIYKLNDKKTEFIVDIASKDTDYDSFLENLPENDCRYAVYDFDYEVAPGEGKRNKIIFFAWSPDSAPVRSKMVYASSREGLRRSFTGIASEVQGTDFSEVSHDSVLERVTRGTH